MAYNTGNPSGSSDPRDLSDSAADIDTWATSTTTDTHTDRLGTARKTWRGMENEFDADQTDRAQRFDLFLANSGYQFIGDYAAGIDLTEYNQVVRDVSGNLWRVSASTVLPYTTTGAGLPEGGAFIAIGDADLAQNLISDPSTGQGALLVRGSVIYVGTIADLQALPTSELMDGQQVQVKEYHAGTGVGGGVFYWDEASTISDNGGTVFTTTDTTVGRWVRNYIGKVDVTWFGARGDGQYNSSSAFQSAIDFGEAIYVPSGEFLLENVEIKPGTNITGNNQKTSGKPSALKASSSNPIFYTNSETHRISIKNITVTAGKHLLLQNDRANYTAYSLFENIEIYASVECAYFGFFIFTVWRGGRCGYSGTVGVNGHQFIKSIPSQDHIDGFVAQSKTTNLNKIEDVYIFQTAGVNGAVEIEYGYHWEITNADFEGLNSRAVFSRGCFNLNINGTWFESILANEAIYADTSRGMNAHGTILTFENNTVNGETLNVSLLNIRDASIAYVNKNFLFRVSDPVVLDSAIADGYSGIKELENNTGNVWSGFFPEMTPKLKGNSILPIQKQALPLSKFTLSGYTGTSVASVLNPDVNVVSLKLSGGANVAFYELPAKLVEILQGKSITLSALAYSNGVDAQTTTLLQIWVDSTPGFSNSDGLTSLITDPTVTSLQSGYLVFDIPVSATSIAVGFRSGGTSNASAATIVESLNMLIGEFETDIVL